MELTWLSLVGHISFALVAASFLMRSMVWLRLLAISSLLIGIGYNAYIAQTAPELWTVVGWQLIFLAINITQSVLLVIENSEVNLSEQQRMLLAEAFPMMRTRSFLRLMNAGQTRDIEAGTVLVEQGSHMDRLILVVRGTLTLVGDHQDVKVIGRGRMVGDITASTGENYAGSPYKIIAGDDASILTVSNVEIARLRDKYPDFAFGFTDGIVRGLAKKMELLIPVAAVTGSGRLEVSLTDEQRLAHALLLSSMSTNYVKDLFELGTREAFKQGDTIANDDRVGIIVKGRVRIEREDNQHIVLDDGNFLGEIGFVAQQEFAVPSISRAEVATEVVWLAAQDLKNVEQSNPSLYISFLNCIAKNLAVKLTRPLIPNSAHGSGVYEFSRHASQSSHRQRTDQDNRKTS